MAKRGKNTTLKEARQAAKLAERVAKEQAKQTQKIAKAQIREMRRYLPRLKKIDLRKEISSAQRGAVTKAWQDYQELTSRPFKIYRTKNKRKLAQVETFAGIRQGMTRFKVAFVPSPDPHSKVVFKKDKVILRTKYADISSLDFDVRELAVNFDAEIARVLSLAPNAQQFVLLVGLHKMYQAGMTRGTVASTVRKLMERYSPGSDAYEKRGPNSAWQNWLRGLEVIETRNQGDANAYRKEYSKSARDAQAERRRKRRRNKAKYGRKF